ncbi:MAG: type III pantothenate kinase [Chlorobi bacterium]|nr:MAG: type III pantothenate kinase [Bacteroidota bacterium]KXK34606.1 MAG: type III pantothenate kinase [Chlorobi bacterium OLB6]MBE2265930.1 type III pantothenate kinase [Flavobacteriales bacterium]MBL1160909.1 type III pantothenate kinase [Chlorobiota bacterium]MBW7852870.1 type III pantothenate kinase [Candidatus Kapabacteria bacterium]MCC6330899.1 type III pantothenate kinase [Ignavibacteria bacterium]
MATLYDTTIELNSVQYGICGIDVGNSRVKIHHDDVYLSIPFDKEWKKNVQHHFRDHVSKKYLIGLSSVNPKQTTAIVKIIQRIPGHLVINVHQLLMRNEALLRLGSVENAGIDRMLGAIGALFKQLPPLITVDCGTAVTVNAISKDRMFLGGIIFAGMTTQLVGLTKQTAGIPETEYSQPVKAIGVNTQESLMAGVTQSVLGGVLESIQTMQNEFFNGAQVPIVITGGEGKVIAETMGHRGLDVHFERDMVTTGILSLLMNAKPVDIHDGIIEKIRN